MKAEYVELKVEIVEFSNDVITTSNGDEYGDDIWE